ncbi:MAG: signal transduction histidine kinase [bacterium]
MKRKLLITLCFLAVIPLGLLAWIGIQVNQNEQMQIQAKFQEVFLEQLNAIKGQVNRFVEQKETQLLKTTQFSNFSPETIRAFTRKNRFIKQVFVLDRSGKRLHPPKRFTTQQERDFLVRTKSIWESKERFYHPDDTNQVPKQHGWYTWFLGDGVNFIFWKRTNGYLVGVEINRIIMMSELIGVLPLSKLKAQKTFSASQSRIILKDAKGIPIYQWGNYHPNSSDQAIVSLELSAPLNMWKLEYFANTLMVEKAIQKQSLYIIFIGLSILGVCLLSLVFYFYRESSREIHEAVQRVTFVNQVSHELKTPLTNIRMYAELLDMRILEEDEKSHHYLGVVITESQRLSRLISNVLSFAKKEKEGLTLIPSNGVVDQTIESVLENFRPVLEAKSFKINFIGNATQSGRFDKDFIEQILGNLISNVEKYASQGKYLQVTSQQKNNLIEVFVIDQGSGIPKSHQEKIFEPFERISNQLNDGVTGTGIGLSIARDMAKLHGGDLTLEASQEGATFKLSFHLQP